MARPASRRQADALAELIGESVRLHSQLVAASDRMSRDLGLTGARWQLLSVIGRGTAAYTVSDLARWMGLTRQTVQRMADALTADGLVTCVDNPNHRRAPLLKLTTRGQTLLGRLDARRFRWAREVGSRLQIGEIEAAAEVLKNVRRRLGG